MVSASLPGAVDEVTVAAPSVVLEVAVPELVVLVTVEFELEDDESVPLVPDVFASDVLVALPVSAAEPAVVFSTGEKHPPDTTHHENGSAARLPKDPDRLPLRSSRFIPRWCQISSDMDL